MKFVFVFICLHKTAVTLHIVNIHTIYININSMKVDTVLCRENKRNRVQYTIVLLIDVTFFCIVLLHDCK